MKLVQLTLSLCAIILPTAFAQSSGGSEIDQLKAQLAQQQQQIELLRQSLESQQKMIDRLSSMAVKPAEAAAPAPAAPGFTRVGGAVASTTGALPAMPDPVPPARVPYNPPPAAQAAAPAQSAPLQLQLGDITIMPVGFMDATAFWRDKDAATGTMGSNFGSVPYNNGVTGNLSEYHFSIQNSRLGFRVDGNWKGAHFIGYNEFDFNGTSGSTALAVSNGAVVPRLRLYWVDVRKGPVEFLAGQSWSMMVPGRKGISPLPGDLFYSQVVDINYVAGLTWTRQPGFRVMLHGAQDKVTYGFSVEQADQYIGGSGGGGAITLPSALAGLVPTQLDSAGNISGASFLQTPTLTPDFITKLALDPSSRFHFEVGGILSTFKTASLTAPWTHHTKTGGGLVAGVNAEVIKGVRLIANGMLSDGEGRYLFGAAPDIIIRGDGSLSPLRSDGYVTGIEATVKNTLLYAYYSGDYIGRNVALDTNGTSLIGYGYRGSANSQNRSIQEVTFGFNQTMWRDPRYGAINLMGQYEYLMRDPWYVAAGSPKATHDNTIYFNLRYTLPGGAPAIK